MKRIKTLWSSLSSLNQLYLLALCSVFMQFALGGIEMAPDSQSYIDAWKNHYGILDYTRTPVYPILLGFIGLLFPEKLFLYGVFLFQVGLFILSIRWFYRLTERILYQTCLPYIATFFYSVHPCVSSWTLVVLTESMSISLMVGFLYFFYKSYIEYDTKSIIMSVAMVFFLVFLRPALIFLLPEVLLIYLLMLFRSRTYLMGVVGMVIVCVSVIAYMYSFEIRYGAFTTSRIGAANQYYCARQYGYIKPTGETSIEFNNYIDNSIKKYGECPNSFDSLGIEAHQASILFPINDINYAIIETSKVHPERLLTSICRRILAAAQSPLFECMNIRFSFISSVLGPNIGSLLFMLIFYMIYCVYQVLCMKNNQNLPYLSMLIVMIIIGNFLMVSIGSYQCYGRLFIASVPCALILLSQLYQKIVKNRILV